MSNLSHIDRIIIYINKLYGKNYKTHEKYTIEKDGCGWFYIGFNDNSMSNPWYIFNITNPNGNTFSCDDYYSVQSGEINKSQTPCYNLGW